MQTRYHADRSVTIYATFRSGTYTASLKTGYFDDPHRKVGLLHRLTEHIYGLSIPLASFSYTYSMVQTRCHGDRSVPTYPAFRSGPYTASLETGYFDGPHREGGLLHRLTEYISGLSIPLASFWYKYFLDANTVPCR